MSDEIFTSNNPLKNTSILKNNKLISFCVLFSCLLFLAIIFTEKTKILLNLVPTMRGEVTLSDGFVITSIKGQYPLIIKKDDPFVGDQLRYTGGVKSVFSEIAMNLCKKKDIVVEIGSHFGYNVINLGNYLKGNGEYYALEPNTKIFSCLNKNIVINDLDSTVHTINKAVSDHCGTCVIDDVLSYQKMEDSTYNTPNTIAVECSTLDREITDKNLSLLLIDVPGVEFSIIRGAQNILERSKKIILLVNVDCEASSKKADVLSELTKLEKNGFKFFETEAPNDFKEIQINEILEKKKLLLIITRDKI